MGVNACGWGQVDQIDITIVEIVEIVEENAVIMGGRLRESNIIIERGQGGGVSAII